MHILAVVVSATFPIGSASNTHSSKIYDRVSLTTGNGINTHTHNMSCFGCNQSGFRLKFDIPIRRQNPMGLFTVFFPALVYGNLLSSSLNGSLSGFQLTGRGLKRMCLKFWRLFYGEMLVRKCLCDAVLLNVKVMCVCRKMSFLSPLA